MSEQFMQIDRVDEYEIAFGEPWPGRAELEALTAAYPSIVVDGWNQEGWVYFLPGGQYGPLDHYLGCPTAVRHLRIDLRPGTCLVDIWGFVRHVRYISGGRARRPGRCRPRGPGAPGSSVGVRLPSRPGPPERLVEAFGRYLEDAFVLGLVVLVRPVHRRPLGTVDDGGRLDHGPGEERGVHPPAPAGPPGVVLPAVAGASHLVRSVAAILPLPVGLRVPAELGRHRRAALADPHPQVDDPLAVLRDIAQVERIVQTDRAGQARQHLR
ncbi:hypothetical protein [Kitasatospora sp. NPDC050463]|uniref:hypothetical protein n=1 Tax=Kitasatospora sp. NPDC050463 TaxID=3155786 RepID=UPI0033F05C89